MKLNLSKMIAMMTIVMLNAGAIMFLVPSASMNARADSPYQNITGVDFIQEAYDIEAYALAHSGRQTDNSTDGERWNNVTWDQSSYLAQDKLMKNNNDLSDYSAQNISLSNGVFSVSANDSFDDEAVGSMWTSVTASGGAIVEGFCDTNSLKVTGAYTAGTYVWKSDTSAQNNYTISQNATTAGLPYVAHKHLGGFGIVSGNETMDSLPSNIQFYVEIAYHSYNLRINVWYYTDALVKTSLHDRSLNVDWPADFQLDYMLEYNSTHVLFGYYDYENDYWFNCTPVLRTDIIYGESDHRHIVIGEIYNNNYCNLAAYFTNYTQTVGPASGWYQSPGIACGWTDTRFRSMTWTVTGGTAAVMLETSNDAAFTYLVERHTITSGTNYLASFWFGAYMRFNVTIDAGETFDPSIFQTYGSCNGIYLNLSMATLRIDRDTYVYGKSIIMNKNILVNPDAITTKWDTDYAVEFDYCDIDFQHAYYVDPDKDPNTVYSFKFENCTLYDEKVSDAFIVAGWEGGTDQFLYFNNISAYSFISMLDTTYVGIYYFASAKYCDLYPKASTLGISLYECNNNYILGGYNGTGGGYDKWQGINSMRAKYNYINVLRGGNGIVASHSQMTGTGNELLNVSYNYVVNANYVGLGSYGGNIPTPTVPSGFRNAYGTFWKNYVNDTHGHPLAGIGYSLSFGYGEENGTFKNCYIFGQNIGSTAGSYIHHVSANCSVIDCVFYDFGTVNGINFQDGCYDSNVWGNLFVKIGGTCVSYSVGIDYGNNMMGNNTFIWCHHSPVVSVGDLGYNTGNETFIQCNGTYAYAVADDASLYIWNSQGISWEKIDSGTVNSHIYLMLRNRYVVSQYNIPIIVWNETWERAYNSSSYAKIKIAWLVATQVDNNVFTNHSYRSSVYIELDIPIVYRNDVEINYVKSVWNITFVSPPGSVYEIGEEPIYGDMLDAGAFLFEFLRLVIPLLLIVVILLLLSKFYGGIEEYLR